MYFIQFVYGGADCPKLRIRNTASLKQAIQNLSVVDLDDVILQIQRVEDFRNNSNAFHIRNHWIGCTGNIEILISEIYKELSNGFLRLI